MARSHSENQGRPIVVKNRELVVLFGLLGTILGLNALLVEDRVLYWILLPCIFGFFAFGLRHVARRALRRDSGDATNGSAARERDF